MEVKDFLLQLPDWCRTLALANHCAYNKKLPITPTNVHEALTLAFKWASTPEGKSFWTEVHMHSKSGFYQKIDLQVKVKRVKAEKVIIPKVKFKKVKAVKKVSKIKLKEEEKTYGTTFNDMDSALVSIFASL